MSYNHDPICPGSLAIVKNGAVGGYLNSAMPKGSFLEPCAIRIEENINTNSLWFVKPQDLECVKFSNYEP